MPTKEYFTWEDFGNAEDYLANEIKSAMNLNKVKFTGIYGIPRGGLIPAVALSHLLELPFINTENLVVPTTLVVDDISDTGKALKLFADYGCKMATIHYVRDTKVMPHFFYKRREADWVVYPWEVDK